MRKIMVVLLGACTVVHAQLPLSDPLQKSGKILGKISIPSINLTQTVREGVHKSIINLGVAHWLGSAQSGEVGNMVLAGHRTTKTAPFLKIAGVHINDEVLVTNSEGVVAKYLVYEMFIVDRTGVYIINAPDNPEDAILTIFTCHPFYSAAQRFVVRARLVSP